MRTCADLAGVDVLVVGPRFVPHWQAEAVHRLVGAGASVTVETRGAGLRADPGTGPLAPVDLHRVTGVPDDGAPGRTAGSSVVLSLGGPDGAPPAAGSWAFDFGADDDDGPVPGTVEVALVQVSTPEHAEVLRRARVRDVSHDAPGTLERLLGVAAELPVRAALDAVRGVGVSETGAPRRHVAPVPPARLLDARGAVSTWCAGSRAQVQRLTKAHHWSVGLLIRPGSSAAVELGSGSPAWAPLPADGGFLADPFLVPASEPPVVLAEQLVASGLRGRLVRLEYGSGGWSRPEPVLELPVHASYPYTFRAEGRLWMVPETSGLREVRLYRGSEDARRWELHAVLLRDRALADATVFRREGRWWLLAADADAGVNTHLCVFWADQLQGPWHEHAGNPVKVDIASARPAGTPWTQDGRLFRPGQDSSTHYGSRVVVHDVARLDPEHYVETPVRFLEPQPGSAFPDGLHTVSLDGTRVVIDGCHRKTAWRRIVPALRAGRHRAPSGPTQP